MATAKVLAIGGGGGGGYNSGGGGGAGGYQYDASHTVSPGVYSVTIGDGGIAGTVANRGGTGGDSTFDTITANGGGGGGSRDSGQITGGNGGSGGGGAGATDQGTPSGGTGNQGNNGGLGVQATGNKFGGGGGGGAGAVGADCSGDGNTPGNGGNGTSNSITGSPVVYAGGGGGGMAVSTTNTGSGGTGGGGNGGAVGTNVGNPGTDGLGGGGGGGSNANGGVGGKGVVIVRWATSDFGTCSVTGGGNAIVADGSDSVATFVVNGNLTLGANPDISVLDNVTTSENLGEENDIPLAVDDTTTVSDFPGFYPDIVFVSEEVAGDVVTPLSVEDSTTTSEDTIVEAGGYNLAVDESSTTSEDTIVEVIPLEEVSDDVNVTDFPGFYPDLVFTTEFVDLLVFAILFTGLLTDSTTTSETTDLVFSVDIDVFDSSSVTESSAITFVAIVPPVFDSATVSDFVATNSTPGVTPDETITINEFVSLFILEEVGLFEAVSVSDVPVITLPIEEGNLIHIDTYDS